MALMTNLGYSQYCLSFVDAGSKLLKSLIYLFKPQNIIDGHFQVYLVEKERNLFQSSPVFMDKDEVILLSLFSSHPVIFAAGCTEEYPFD